MCVTFVCIILRWLFYVCWGIYVYKKILILCCLMVNTFFFMGAASGQGSSKALNGLTQSGLSHISSSSYTLCAAAASASTLAQPIIAVIKPDRKMSIFELYPVAKAAAASNNNSTTNETLSQHNSSMQLSEDTDEHYKQHASNVTATNVHEISAVHQSTSCISTVEDPLGLYGG